MAQDKPKRRRSFRVIFKLIKFVFALVMTFIISFLITLTVKVDDVTEHLGNFAGFFVSEDEPIKSTGAQEISTLFDEQNKRPFDAEKVSDEKPAKVSEEKVSDEKTPVREERSREVNPPPPPPNRKSEDVGFFDTFSRMTSIKPAVDAKLKDIPHYVTLEKIPFLLQQAVVSVEDQRFYTHKGFDLFGIARAALVNVEAGEIQEGASTITQQTVKNLFLTSDQTFTRKVEELILAMNMENEFKKDKILEIYLNVIYFGSNFYGIYEASHGYFGKEPADLTIAECAMLAGLPNAPSLYSPYVDFHLAKKRQLVVIDAMEKMGVISKLEAENARIEETILAQ